jgi:type VI secretion system secreted protein Hcp
MAVDMFIEIDGVNGDSKIKSNAIDIETWSFGATQSSTGHRSTGSGAGKVNIQDVQLMKLVDKASATLLLKCCKGEHIKKAKIVCRKAAGGAPIDYYTIEMEDVLITSVQTSGSNGGDQIMEAVGLNFGAFKLVYTEQKTDGSKGSPVECGWNITENKSK